MSIVSMLLNEVICLLVKEKKKIPTFEEYTKKHGELINVEQFREILGMSRELFLEVVEKGVFPKNKIAVAHVDVQPKKRGWAAKYYFNKEWAENFKREDIGLQLKEIAKELNIKYRWLIDISSKKPELIEEGKITSQLWNLQWFKDNIQKVHEESYSNKGQFRKSEFYDMLTEEQQQWIEGYLNRRKSGEGVLVGRKIEWGTKPAKPEKAIKEWRKKLSLMFYKIICGRAGIQNYHELERMGKLRDLTDQEREMFDNEKNYFIITDFMPADVERIKIGYKDTTFSAMVESVLTPFLYYVLSKLKENWIELKQTSKKDQSKVTKDDIDEAKELYEDFDISVEMSLSKTPARRIDTAENDEEIKIHLSHEEILLAKNIIRQHSFNEPLKRLLIFMFGCLVGIRPEEFAHLKIENFILDSNTNLLKRFKFDEEKEDFVELPPGHPDYLKGYGRLWIDYNKGGYSKSHKDYGTLIVPRLTTLINSYLESVLYVKHPKSKGKGYLIRPKAALPYKHYTGQGIGRWLSTFSHQYFDFLSDEPVHHTQPDKTPRNSFKYYDVRHTVYNLIDKTNVAEIDDKTKDRAAQIHARHDVRKKQGNTGWTNYTSDISLKNYYLVIDKVLNFPWDLGENQNGEFYDWAHSNGIIVKTIENDKNVAEILEVQETERSQLGEEKSKELNELLKKLAENEEEAAKLANGPSGQYKDVNKWVAKTVELDKEIKNIKKKIKLIKAG